MEDFLHLAWLTGGIFKPRLPCCYNYREHQTEDSDTMIGIFLPLSFLSVLPFVKAFCLLHKDKPALNAPQTNPV